MRHETVANIVARAIPENAYAEQWNVDQLHEECLRVLNLDLPVKEWAKEEGIADAEIRQRLTEASDRKMAEKAANYGPEIMRMAEKSLLLQILDQQWKEHLLHLDHLRQGINLRAYGQRDPLNEYKAEAFALFEAMIAHLREAVTAQLMRVEIVQPPAEEASQLPYMEAHKVDPSTGEDEMALAAPPLAAATLERIRGVFPPEVSADLEALPPPATRTAGGIGKISSNWPSKNFTAIWTPSRPLLETKSIRRWECLKSWASSGLSVQLPRLRRYKFVRMCWSRIFMVSSLADSLGSRS